MVRKSRALEGVSNMLFAFAYLSYISPRLEMCLNITIETLIRKLNLLLNSRFIFTGLILKSSKSGFTVVIYHHYVAILTFVALPLPTSVNVLCTFMLHFFPNHDYNAKFTEKNKHSIFLKFSEEINIQFF